MIKIVISLYLVGLCIFYTAAIEHSRPWALAYYLWDKSVGGGFMLWYCIHFLYSHKMITRPIVLFSLVRFIWELVSALTGISVNNSAIVAVLFLILSLVTGFLILKENSRPNLWLSKHLNI